MEITPKHVDSELRCKVNEAMEEYIENGRKFKSKQLERVAAGVLFVELRATIPDLNPSDVTKRAVYAARNFIETQNRNKRIENEGKHVAYPLVWQLKSAYRRRKRT